MIKLFTVGFPRHMDETQLAALFMQHGRVINVTIITDRETGTSMGYGFIQMNDPEEAGRAIANLDGLTIEDRQLNVKIADDKRANAAKVFTTKPAGIPGTPKYVKVKNPTTLTKKKRPRKQI